MEIYEKIFKKLEELHMSQTELARKTGIATSTISDWKKKKINPQADKLLVIAEALEMSPIELLKKEDEIEEIPFNYSVGEKYIIECYRKSDGRLKKNIMTYFEMLNESLKMSNKKSKRNVSVIQDVDGKDIVVLNDIKFKGKRGIRWKEVREYLKEFVGDVYTIDSTGDAVYIGADLPNEYSGSEYTFSIKGTKAKAKANASQGIPELIEIASGKHHRANDEKKHWKNAKYGWYRYDSRFALPVYGEDDEIVRYNVFHASLIVRHSEDEKMYLYDILDIKKRNEQPD